MKTQVSTLESFKLLSKDIYKFNPFKAIIACLLMVLVGITNGISVALLIPLLNVVGIGNIEGTGSTISSKITELFSVINLSITLISVLILFYFIIVCITFLQYQQVKFASNLSNFFSAFIRKRLYEHIFNAQWSFFIKEKMAHSANILTVESQRIRAASDCLFRLISESIISINYLIVAYIISWKTATIIVFTGIMISWLIRRFIQSGRELGKNITDANNNLLSAVWEHLGSAKIIKSYACEIQTAKLFQNLVYRAADLNSRAMINQAGIKAIFDPIMIFMLCLGLYVAVAHLKMDAADLLVILLIFFRLSPKIALIQQNYHQLITTLPSYNEILSLERETKLNPEYGNGKNEITNYRKGILFKDVGFKYQPAGKEIINNANLFIPKGKTVALVGESGSGKSTIADLILGLLKSDEGTIFVDDIDINKIEMKSWRSLIGYVTQDTVLFHDTVLENLKWASPNATDEEILNVIKIASAHEFVNNLSEGINTIIGDRGMRLSGGQRQRLALARALLRKPSLLILDEATSSLDAESENKIKNAIELLHGSITILVISHRLATVRNADIIYILDKGNIVAQGSWEELIRTDQEYFKRMCELQGLF